MPVVSTALFVAGVGSIALTAGLLVVGDYFASLADYWAFSFRERSGLRQQVVLARRMALVGGVVGALLLTLGVLINAG